MRTSDERAAIRAIAWPQGGYIHQVQLLALGLTRRAIDWRLASGELVWELREVYAVGHRPTHPLARAHAPLLAIGPRSALGYGSAAYVHGMSDRWHEPADVITPLHRRPSGVRMHQSTALRASDIRIVHGLRVTSPAITALHIAPRTPPKRLLRIVNELRIEGRLQLEEVHDTLERFPRHPGARRLKEITSRPAAEPARSNWEEEWLGFAAAYDLGPYETNVRVCGHRVDVLIDRRLVVELDGWDTHSTKPAFRRDRNQDADILARTGIPTVRITHDQFHTQPDRPAARIAQILARLG